MEKQKITVRNAIKAAAEEFYPRSYRCLLCGIEIFEGDFCADCFKRLRFNDGATCPVCGRKTSKNEICIECKADLPKYKKAVSALVYEDYSVLLLINFKRRAAYLCGWLAERMAQKLPLLPHADGIVFVPMTRRAEQKRGYNQAELLAQSLAELSGIPLLRGAVQKTEDTPMQKELSKAGREKNLLKCFKAEREAVKGKTLLLVDDIATTGATLNSLAECLKKSGAAEVYCITAASVPYSPPVGNN